MPKTRSEKEEQLNILEDKFSKSKSVVFADYRGMTMSQLSVIRDDLADQSSEFTVAKNTLIKLALKNKQIEVDQSQLEGPTAVLFAYADEIAPIKALTKAIKDTGIGEIKGGLLNGEAINADKVKTLSTLPSKEELRGKVVGALGGPLYGIVGVLQANLRNVVYVLEQIRKQKGGE